MCTEILFHIGYYNKLQHNTQTIPQSSYIFLTFEMFASGKFYQKLNKSK